MKHFLITGVNGWTGRHLALRILQGAETWVIGLDLAPELGDALRPFASRIHYYQYDLANSADALAALLKTETIDGVIHLAGVMASVEWTTLLQTNVLGTVTLLSALAMLYANEAPPILVTSSSAVYGEGTAEEFPMTESYPLRPVTPYGVSKAAQEMTACKFMLTEKLPVIIVRPFNLIGPEQPVVFVSSSIARQIAQAEARREPARVQLGRLDSKRDFVDIRDAVDLYLTLLGVGSCGEAFNCGTGLAHSIGQVVESFCSLAQVEVAIEQQPSLFRSGDARVLRADLSKVAAATNWRPTISLQQSLTDLLNTWREKILLEMPV